MCIQWKAIPRVHFPFFIKRTRDRNWARCGRNRKNKKITYIKRTIVRDELNRDKCVYDFFSLFLGHADVFYQTLVFYISLNIIMTNCERPTSRLFDIQSIISPRDNQNKIL